MYSDKYCFHCGLEISKNVNYSLTLNDKIYSMCCNGCLVVSKFIFSNNFGDYYLYRTDFNKTVNECLISENNIYDDISYQSKFLIKKNNFDYVVLFIDGITCAACTWLIEKHLKKINGIKNIFVNLTTSKAHITFDLNILKLSFLISELFKIGYIAYPYSYKKLESKYKLEYKKELKKLIVAGLGMSQVMMLSASLYIGEYKDMHYLYWSFIRWINFFITTPILFFCGSSILYNSVNNLKSKFFGMDFTVSLSLLLAYFSSLFNLINNSGDVYFDSICMFLFFLLIGRFLEMRARHHSNDIIYSLQELTIGTANLIKEGKVVTILHDEIKMNDIILVKPGEIIPTDGKIIDGITNIDESILTGESLPVLKKVGFFVLGGSTNIENVILIRSIKDTDKSTLNIIIKLLDESVSFKPKINLFYDKVASFFIVIVLIITCIVSFLWFIFSDQNVVNVTLSMLVITCPCALSLAAPVAITSTINYLTKNGFLITKNYSLENISKVSDIVFDKTGTLTVNEFFLKKIKLNGNFNIKYIFSLAYLLEENSKHPISYAFLNSDLEHIHINYSKDNIKNYTGSGIEGEVNGIVYRLGNDDFIKNWVKKYIFLKNEGINIILSDKDNILAWFNLVNPLRKNIFECINEIKKLNIIPHIVSGDSSDNVNNVADILDIRKRSKGISVDGKVNYIKKLQNDRSVVMMIGDGINDAPALAISNISVSMGSGIDLAKITSDAILLNNNLSIIVYSINQSKKMNIVINQNIIWSIFYNIFGLILAALNLISPYYAAIGMSISSLLVVLNSLRLNKF